MPLPQSLYPFNSDLLKERRRALRNGATMAEVILWRHLKGKGLYGWKFRRQFGVGRYILDFYCHAARLAIEVDGPSHNQPGAARYDARRQQEIEEMGIRFLRFTNQEVYRHIEGVAQRIADELAALQPRA